VAAAHAEGLLHRDLKPANVIVTPDGRPVLIDFGLAGGDAGPTLTLSGDVIGTPNYMAPEQARGEAATEASDVFGLGAILYELLTLGPPHPGDDPLSVVDAIQRRPVTRVRKIDSLVPRSLETIVMRCLAHAPRSRYASAAAVAEDLEAFSAGRPIAARPPSIVERTVDFLHFHRVAAGATALLAVVALLGALLVFQRDDGAAEAKRRLAVAAAARAWAAGDANGLRRAAETLRSIAADAPSALAAFLAAEADGRDANASDDPALEALARGAARLRAKQPEAALEPLRRAADLAPGSVLPIVLLATAARRAGRLDEAEEVYATAVRLLPDSAALRHQLGRVYRDRGRLAEAARSFEEGLRLEPDDARGWNRLARARGTMEMKKAEKDRDFTAAHEAARRAVELAGTKVTPGQLRTLAHTLDRLHRFEESHALYRELLERDPSSYGDRYSYAFSLDLAHDTLAAREQYLKLLALQPNRPEPAFALAWIHAGARRGECEACDALYARHPELYDPDSAERYALQSLQNGRGRNADRVEALVSVAKKIGRSSAIAARLKSLKAEAYERGDNERAARLDRALFRLARLPR